MPDRTVVIPSGTGDYYVGRITREALQGWVTMDAQGQEPRSAVTVMRLSTDAVATWLQDHPHDRLIAGGGARSVNVLRQRLHPVENSRHGYSRHEHRRPWHIYHAAAPCVLPWWSQEMSWDTMDKPVYLDLHETRILP